MIIATIADVLSYPPSRCIKDGDDRRSDVNDDHHHYHHKMIITSSRSLLYCPATEETWDAVETQFRLPSTAAFPPFCNHHHHHHRHLHHHHYRHHYHHHHHHLHEYFGGLWQSVVTFWLHLFSREFVAEKNLHLNLAFLCWIKRSRDKHLVQSFNPLSITPETYYKTCP